VSEMLDWISSAMSLAALAISIVSLCESNSVKKDLGKMRILASLQKK